MSVTVNHTGITVADLDHSEAMFREFLGFHTLSRAARDPAMISGVIGVPDATVEVSYMRNGAATVELLCYSGPEGRGDFRPRPCDLGSLHMGFDTDDLDATIQRAKTWGLVAMGKVVIVSAGPNKGARIVYLRDPKDGLVIEFIQKAPSA